MLVFAACAESSTATFAGGNSISLKKIVDMHYEKVLADAALAPFFEKIDMQKLKKHQVRTAAGRRQPGRADHTLVEVPRL